MKPYKGNTIQHKVVRRCESMEQDEIVKRLTGFLLPLHDETPDPQNYWIIKEIVRLIKDISGKQIIISKGGFHIPP